jgi:hypothetical protein
VKFPRALPRCIEAGVRPEVEVTHRKCRNDPRSLCVTSTSGLTPAVRDRAFRGQMLRSGGSYGRSDC